jgi:signal transduction histidine kinase
LISNSKYWLAIKGARKNGFVPSIKVTLLEHPISIIFEDNGQGIAPENREKVFKAWFSLKESSKRRGLGLFIARECAVFNKATLTLEDNSDPETGRLHRFVLEFPEGGQ